MKILRRDSGRPSRPPDEPGGVLIAALRSLAALVAVSLLPCVAAKAQTAIPAGSGSYSSSLPATGVAGDDGGDGPTIADMLDYYQGGVAGYTTGGSTYHMWLSPSLYGSGKAVPTNQWWSYLMFGVGGGGGNWSQSTNNAALWVFPQVVAPTSSGMWLYSPAAYENRAYSNPVAYMNAGPYLTINDTAGGHTFSSVNPVVSNYGDWTVSYTQSDTSSSGTITTTVARGVPFVWCQYSGAVPQISINGDAVADINGNPINLSSGSFTATAFSMTSRGRTFGIYAPANTTFTVSGNTITPSGNPAYMVYGLLPDPQHCSEFSNYAYALPTGSQMNYTYDQTHGLINTTWNLTTTALNGTDTQTLQGWLPHHYHNTTNNLAFKPYSFITPRGVLQFASGTSWNIAWKFRGITPLMPAPTDGGASPNPFSATRMNTYINQYESTGNHPVFVAETYDEGKELYNAATYLTMADQMGQTTTKSQLLTNSETLLNNWYTYSGSGDGAYFGLLGNYGALIGIPESFSSAALNDNHYHYGYFINSSALIGLYDPTWLQNYAPMIELVAKEYANWDRTDKTFPYLRVFDAWEGHSWASGYGFQSGQTEESYSESMDGWAGLFLLGNSLLGTNTNSTTANNIIAAGAMGYTLEASAVNEYWQDTKHTNMPDSYGFDGVGTVWAGWSAYQQGFTADPAWNYGVSMLPEANWENYQTRDAAYESKLLGTDLWAERAETAKEGIAAFSLPDANNGFNVLTGYSQPGEPGDYFLGIQALSDPLTTVSEFDTYQAAGAAVATTTNLAAGGSCSPGIAYYLAHSSRSFGVQDYDYYTSMPSSSVYYNAATGVRTAVIYNPNSTSQTVTVYNNGTSVGTVTAPAHQLTTYNVGGAAMVTVPSAPSSLTATAGSGQVTLSWSAVAGATSYDLYREVSGGGYFITNITGTTYTDTGLSALGQKYTYKVYGVNSEGMSAPSVSASVRLYGAGIQQATDWLYDLAGPSSKSTPGWYTNGGDLNDFGYDGIATRVDNGTEWMDYSYPNLTNFSLTVWSLNYPVSSVQFFTSTNNGSTFTALPVTVSAPTQPNAWTYYTISPAGSMPAGVTDLKIQVPPAGGTQNNWDPELGPISFTYGGFTVPAAPSVLIATPGNASVSLSWNASGGATSYNVYRATASGAEGSTPIATGITGTTYVDNGVTNGTTYYYTVAALNAQGASPQSGEARATPQLSNTVTDYLNDFTVINSKSGNWTIDASNPTFFAGDTARATRTADDAEFLTYKFTGITTFNATVYTLNGPISVATFYSSPDGVTYTAIPVTTGTETATASGWGFYKLTPSGTIPTGTNYLKVQFASGTGNAWDPQLGQISITYGGATGSAPAAPTGLTATPGNAQIVLSWTASTGATSYNLYRSTTSGGEGSTALVAGITSTSYTNTGLTNGTTYYYTVAAVNANGTSAQSSQASATPSAPPAAPTGLTPTAGNTQVALAWTGSTGATSYNLYRSTTSGGEGSTALVTGITSTSYTNTGLTNGTTYYYTVAAVNASGTSTQSNQASATPTAPQPPAAPTGLTASPGNTQITLAWTASSGATTYNIYRSITSGGEGTTALVTGVTTTSYTNTGLTNGTAYYYTVAAVNANGTSAQSSQATATPQGSNTVTDYLNDFTVVNSKSGNWTIDSSNPTYFNGDTGRATRTVDDTEYLVYKFSGITTFNATVYIYTGPVSVATFYSSPDGVTYTQVPVATGSETASSAGWGYYRLTPSGSIPSGTNYLKVQFTSGTANAWDPQLSQITLTYGGASGSAPLTPTGLTATAGNAQIALSWTASTGATTYNIYRSTSSGGEGSTPIATGVTSPSYTNTGLTNGTAYYYTVAAVNTYGTSAQSGQATATPTAPQPPAAPTGLTATAGNAHVSLSWTGSTGASSYNVYRSTVSGGEGTTAIASGITGTTYTDSSLTNGTAYFYTVAAVNANGTSAQSSQATATPTGGTGGTSGPASINCGGSAVSPFVADTDFSGGSTGSTTSTIATPYVSNPAPPQSVLQSWRTGSAFTYTLGGFTAGSGHTVQLYFMEPTATGAGQRQFNVTVSGTQVLTNFDLYSATGGQFKAIQENFNGTANSSGQIVVSFTSGAAGSPIVEAITAN